MANGRANKNVEKVEEKKVENKAVEEKKETEKTAEIETAEKTVKEIVGTIEQRLKETLKTLDVEDLKKKIKELEEIEKKIEELNDKRMEIMDSLITTMETVDVEMFRTLKALGINGITDTVLKAHEIVKKAMNEINEEIEEESPKRATVRAKRGEGIGKRKINFKGRVYNMAQYFMKKHGITGGLEGLKAWCQANGYNMEITDDMIIIS